MSDISTCRLTAEDDDSHDGKDRDFCTQRRFGSPWFDSHTELPSGRGVAALSVVVLGFDGLLDCSSSGNQHARNPRVL